MPPIEPAPPEVPGGIPVATWRKILWSLCVILVVGPVAWVPGIFLTSILLQFGLGRSWRRYEDTLLWVVPSLVALLAVWWVLRAGLRRDRPGRRNELVSWGVSALVMVVLGVAATLAMTKVRDSSRLKAMIPRQPAAAIDQFFLENPYRIFLKYDEIVGPDQYVKAWHSTDGEDLSVQFPIRQGWMEPLPVRLPDGTTGRRLEVLAAIGQSGLIATYPMPQDDQYNPKLVYRLDCGVSFRDWHVVNLPPDAAGREGRDQDGVHTYPFPDGRRYEITYRGGVPDGPFHAYKADGTLWGEATYRQGRVTGPAWNYPGDGTRFNELEADQLPANAARHKLQAGDFRGAVDEFSRALRLVPAIDHELLRDRARAYQGLGDFAAALADLQRVKADYERERWPTLVNEVTEQIARLSLQQAQAHKNAGDPAAAAQELRPSLPALLAQAREKSSRRNYAGAAADYSRIIEILPDAGSYRGRAAARRALGDAAGAVSDLTAALQLKPDYQTYQARAEVRSQLGELDGAIADYTAAMGLAPLIWNSQYRRGHVKRLQSDLAGASRDFRATIAACRKNFPGSACRAAYWLYFTECEQGRAADSATELAQFFAELARTGPAKNEISGVHEMELALGELLLNRGTEAQLFTKVDRIAARDRDNVRFKALFFSALARRQAADLPGALDRFRQALALPLSPLATESNSFEIAEAKRAVGNPSNP